ncbi:NAD(P)-binding protein [Mycena sanguinolenta]|uniref:NAD(P)-binding protein n=1 Tax=Mycena sanguinolenta TaxID=230812 RepID=A0A8H6YVI3_9AGAR|nr:NAD(P)-binding protein [Mycena sanguinolenta]
MPPIRIGLIGLSSSAKTSWASAAHLPYLLSSRGLERYKIVALCNSTIESANGAIVTFGLPSSTRAYGSPVDLAGDAEVDLVVCCTRVDVHHGTIRPALAAGKTVYCEWPLAQDLTHVLDLSQLARDNNVRTMVGLQGRVAPAVQKLKELVNGGRIGKIINVEVRATGGLNHREELPSSLNYFMQRAVGGNVFTIGFGHLWDHIQHVHGDVLNIQSRLQLQFPTNKIRNPSTRAIVESVTSNVPDTVMVTGRLAESPAVQRGRNPAHPLPPRPAIIQ